jgi:hypothetical protein
VIADLFRRFSHARDSRTGNGATRWVRCQLDRRQCSAWASRGPVLHRGNRQQPDLAGRGSGLDRPPKRL